MTWEELHRHGRTLAQLLLGRGPRHSNVRGLVAITRGGLVPAAIVARELNCRMVESVCVATYDEETPGETALLKPPAAAGDGDGWTIIDDLVDTGVTARLVRALLPRAGFACLYAKPAGMPVADVWVEQVPQTTWILFPWDTELQAVPPLVSRG